jgi:hypothetical protein
VASLLLSLTVVGAAYRWPINSRRQVTATGVPAPPNVR